MKFQILNPKFQINSKNKNSKMFIILNFGFRYYLGFSILSLVLLAPLAPAFAETPPEDTSKFLPLVTCGRNIDGKPETTLPGEQSCRICDIWVLSNRVINFAFFLATPILIIVLIAGGFIYLTSEGNPKKTEQAKSLLTSAIVGIVIALAAWLIVSTILKNLAKEGNEFMLPWDKIPTCPKPLEPEKVDLSKLPRPEIIIKPGTYGDAEARRLIELAGIPVVSSQNCSDQLNPKCTSFEGIPKSAVDYILELDRRCNSQNLTCGRFVITGGTEVGHITHGTNKSVLDISPLNPPSGFEQNAQRYRTLRDLAKATGALPDKTFCEKPDGSKTLTCGGASHVHVEFPR